MCARGMVGPFAGQGLRRGAAGWSRWGAGAGALMGSAATAETLAHPGLPGAEGGRRSTTAREGAEEGARTAPAALPCHLEER
jgi:hypothetical protein